MKSLGKERLGRERLSIQAFLFLIAFLVFILNTKKVRASVTVKEKVVTITERENFNTAARNLAKYVYEKVSTSNGEVAVRDVIESLGWKITWENGVATVINQRTGNIYSFETKGDTTQLRKNGELRTVIPFKLSEGRSLFKASDFSAFDLKAVINGDEAKFLEMLDPLVMKTQTEVSRATTGNIRLNTTDFEFSSETITADLKVTLKKNSQAAVLGESIQLKIYSTDGFLKTAKATFTKEGTAEFTFSDVPTGKYNFEGGYVFDGLNSKFVIQDLSVQHQIDFEYSVSQVNNDIEINISNIKLANTKNLTVFLHKVGSSYSYARTALISSDKKAKVVFANLPPGKYEDADVKFTTDEVFPIKVGKTIEEVEIIKSEVPIVSISALRNASNDLIFRGVIKGLKNPDLRLTKEATGEVFTENFTFSGNIAEAVFLYERFSSGEIGNGTYDAEVLDNSSSFVKKVATIVVNNAHVEIIGEPEVNGREAIIDGYLSGGTSGTFTALFQSGTEVKTVTETADGEGNFKIKDMFAPKKWNMSVKAADTKYQNLTSFEVVPAQVAGTAEKIGRNFFIEISSFAGLYKKDGKIPAVITLMANKPENVKTFTVNDLNEILGQTISFNDLNEDLYKVSISVFDGVQDHSFILNEDEVKNPKANFEVEKIAKGTFKIFNFVRQNAVDETALVQLFDLDGQKIAEKTMKAEEDSIIFSDLIPGNYKIVALLDEFKAAEVEFYLEEHPEIKSLNSSYELSKDGYVLDVTVNIDSTKDYFGNIYLIKGEDIIEEKEIDFEYGSGSVGFDEILFPGDYKVKAVLKNGFEKTSPLVLGVPEKIVEKQDLTYDKEKKSLSYGVEMSPVFTKDASLFLQKNTKDQSLIQPTIEIEYELAAKNFVAGENAYFISGDLEFLQSGEYSVSIEVDNERFDLGLFYAEEDEVEKKIETKIETSIIDENKISFQVEVKNYLDSVVLFMIMNNTGSGIWQPLEELMLDGLGQVNYITNILPDGEYQTKVVIDGQDFFGDTMTISHNKKLNDVAGKIEQLQNLVEDLQVQQNSVIAAMSSTVTQANLTEFSNFFEDFNEGSFLDKVSNLEEDLGTIKNKISTDQELSDLYQSQILNIESDLEKINASFKEVYSAYSILYAPEGFNDRLDSLILKLEDADIDAISEISDQLGQLKVELLNCEEVSGYDFAIRQKISSVEELLNNSAPVDEILIIQ